MTQSNRQLRQWVIIGGIITSLFVPRILTAQPDLWVDIQDSLELLYRGDSTDLIPASEFSVMWSFEWVYDSTGRTGYNIAECRQNGRRLRLLGWKPRRLQNVHEAALSDSSRTETVELSEGDTLSFYREVLWYDPKTYEQDTANYCAKDTLDFAVELIDSVSRERLVLLDSIGVLANPVPAAPTIYGMKPMAAVVSYIVPSSLSGRRGFLRVRLYRRGNGDYFPLRYDHSSVRISQRLNDPFFMQFMEMFDFSIDKTVLPTLQSSSVSHGDEGYLDISIHPNSADAAISFRAPYGNGRISIGIFDHLGQLLFMPFSGASQLHTRSINYRFDNPGIYFVAMIHGGRILESKKIHIT